MESTTSSTKRNAIKKLEYHLMEFEKPFRRM